MEEQKKEGQRDGRKGRIETDAKTDGGWEKNRKKDGRAEEMKTGNSKVKEGKSITLCALQVLPHSAVMPAGRVLEEAHA